MSLKELIEKKRAEQAVSIELNIKQQAAETPESKRPVSRFVTQASSQKNSFMQHYENQ